MASEKHEKEKFIEKLEQEEKNEKKGKNSSLTTILSIWNCIMGSGLLTMPWAFEKAGFAQTMVIMVLCGLMCYYTAYLCIKLADYQRKKGEPLPEFQTVCKIYLGPWGEYIALFAADIIVIGALTVYYVLMAKFLYGAGMSIYELSTMPEGSEIATYVDPPKCIAFNEDRLGLPFSPDAQEAGEEESFSNAWQKNATIPLYILVVFFLTNIKNVTFFAKFSAFGTFTVFLIFFVTIYKGAQWGINENVDFVNATSMHYVSQFKATGTAALPGVLSMAYFVHSAVCTLLKDNKNQENNARDLGVAYILVFITYTALGLIFYLSYPGWKGCIGDMFIENFDKREWIVPVMDILMFIRILTVYPLLTYFIRCQNFIVFSGTEWPGYPKVAMVNFFIVALGYFCATFYDKIGNIIRYSGSFCAMIYMFFLPCVVYMVHQKQTLGKVPMSSYIIHGVLILIGIANFVNQFVVEDPYDAFVSGNNATIGIEENAA